MQIICKNSISTATQLGSRYSLTRRFFSATRTPFFNQFLEVNGRQRLSPTKSQQFSKTSSAISTKLPCRFHSTAQPVNDDVSANATTHHDGLAKKTSAQVAVAIDGVEHSFSALLLRDACKCPLCVHKTSRQRLFSVTDIPANIEAQAVEFDAAQDAVSIKWKNDVSGYSEEHTTKFRMAALRGLSQSGSIPGLKEDFFPEQALWSDRPLEIPDYDYEEYMKDDETLYRLVKQLRMDGLAFVTNVPGIVESLATVATRIGPIKDTFYGPTWDVRTVPTAINAAYTSHDLGFHTDLLYFDDPPHVQLLHCVQSASLGGASVFADAYKAALDLFHTDEEAFDVLATVPVNYHYNHPDSNVYRTTKTVIDFRPLRIGNTVYTRIQDYMKDWHDLDIQNGGSGWNDAAFIACLDKINWGPPFLAPFSVDPAPGRSPGTSNQPQQLPLLSVLNEKADRWHEAASKFNALLQRPQYRYERKMKPGDCVLFDNTRTLHSRKAFDMADTGKPRWLRGTYVDKDAYCSTFRVLQNMLGR